MNTRISTRTRLVVVSVAAGISAAVAVPLTVSASGSTPANSVQTPNDCISVNGGDFTACNVGNSGRGDLPYQPVGGAVVSAASQGQQARTPNDCVRINDGDYNACNVGNSGRGDLPYVGNRAV